MILSWQAGAMALLTLVVDRRRHVDVSGAPARGGAAAGRSAALRDVMMTRLAWLVSCAKPFCFGLYHHRFRAALSMLGISWGIISVVVLLAYGDGFRGALDAGFRGAFSDGTVVVFPGQTSLQAGGERAGKRVRVTSDDVMAIGELPLVKNVSPEVHAGVPDRLRQQAVEPSGSRRRRVATA